MGPELISLTQAAGLIATAFATAVAALAVMAMRPGRTSPEQPAPEIAFLFEGDNLVDATGAARQLLDLTDPNGSDIARLIGFLSPRFPELPNSAAPGAGKDAAEMISSDGQSRLRVRSGSGRLHMVLSEIGEPAVPPMPDKHSLSALSDELKMHRAVADGVPFPVWRQTADGQILWANAEYRALARNLGAWDADIKVAPKIFRAEPVAEDGKPIIQRTRLELPNEAEPRWFEFQISRVGGDMLVAAVPVDRVVRAERNLHDFVQTLTQTFAHLNVGLAIFNRSRELAVFNPALTDLLELPPEFLITRPTLFQVFDRLREQRLMPEPKNYRTWRQQMSDLEAAAADGVHSETWSLVDGRTYRVTGRPHPEGAVAFLFEDISAEISLERRFRAEQKLGQAVIDGLDEAVAVFSPSGELAMSNRAFIELWGHEMPANGRNLSFVEASRVWQAASVPTPVWGDARDFAATISERSNWAAEIRLRDGRRISCRFETVSGGCTLAGFATAPEISQGQKPPIPKSASA